MTSSLGLPPGYTLFSFDCLGSTNDEAKRLAEQGSASGTVVWAKEQTAGRGRQGRSWGSPLGNLYCSVVVRWPPRVQQPAQLSFVAALAIADTVRHYVPSSTPVTLKWPNDVLVRGAKISGLLLEGDLTAASPWMVIGMGINVASHPTGTLYPCAHLNGLTDQENSPSDVLPVLMHRLEYWINVWVGSGFSPIRQAWLQHAQGLGQEITARLPEQVLTGVFDSLDDNGALCLNLSDGSHSVITSADIFFSQASPRKAS